MPTARNRSQMENKNWIEWNGDRKWHDIETSYNSTGRQNTKNGERAKAEENRDEDRQRTICTYCLNNVNCIGHTLRKSQCCKMENKLCIIRRKLLLARPRQISQVVEYMRIWQWTRQAQLRRTQSRVRSTFGLFFVFQYKYTECSSNEIP